jgi:4-hydroxy-tetrahydrodipicolinate synthase
MMKNQKPSGIFAASITPLRENLSPDLEAIPKYLSFLAERGCHGALLLGTTGEGPSFEARERVEIFKAAVEVRQIRSDFQLLAGTGTPSIEETIYLSRSAFDLGFDGVVVLPPYYFHQATEDGLFDWFTKLIQRAVPEDGNLLGYHFPAQSRVPLDQSLLVRLIDSFPNQFVGIKDSTSTAEYGLQAKDSFPQDFSVMVGSDKYLSRALEGGAKGCITALANLVSPSLRKIWDAHQSGESASENQAIVDKKRVILEKYPPFGPTIKSLVSYFHGFPIWPVRPPLLPLSKELTRLATQEMEDISK